jgi:hypothetical protein
MIKGIRFVAQSIDLATGEVIEESILREDLLSKARTLKELGYLHSDQ